MGTWKKFISGTMTSEQDDIQAYLSSLVDPREIAEIQEAERDVLGTRSLPLPRLGFQRGDSDMKEAAIKGVKGALLDLPSEKTRAYFRALERDKDLVELESPFERFLLAADYNYWEAADKLSEYWNLRLETFSDAKYHLPLRLDGSGALSSRAAFAFKDGLINFKPYPDEFHRLVIVVDAEYRNEGIHDMSVRKEITFFIMHVASEFDFAVTNGFVLLLCQGTHVSESNPGITPHAGGFRILNSGKIPTRPKAAHILVSRNQSSIMKARVRGYMSLLRMNPILGLRIRAHFSEEKAEEVEEAMIDEMEKYGIHREHLPRRYGGVDDGKVWYRERLQFEAERYATLDQDQAATSLSLFEEEEIDSSGDEADREKEAGKGTRGPDSLDNKEAEASFSRDNFLKRKMKEICFYHKDRNLRRKIAHLQKRSSDLRREETVLRAKIGCAQFLADQFISDSYQIKLYLLKHWVKPVQNPRADNMEVNVQLIDIYMSTLFYFYGRSNDGTFFFSKGRVQLSPDVLPNLGNLFDLLRGLRPLDVYSEIVDSENATDVQHEHEEATMLSRKVDALQKEKTKIAVDNEFLERAQILADEFAKAYDAYKSKHADGLAKSIALIFTRRTRHPASILETPIPDDDPSVDLLRKCRPTSVAGRLIDRIWFLGSEQTGPVLPLSQLEAMIREDGFILPRQNPDVHQGESTRVDSTESEEDDEQFPFLKRRASPSTEPAPSRKATTRLRFVGASASVEGVTQRRQMKVYSRRKPHLKRL